MPIIDLATAKTLLGISTADEDAFIEAVIPEVEADFLQIRNQAFDVDDLDLIEYPAGSVMVAADMIGWHLQKRGAIGVQSSSDSGFSETLEQLGPHGYPVSVEKRITRYLGAL